MESRSEDIVIELRVKQAGEQIVKALRESLLPEVLSQPDRKRGEVEVKEDGEELVVRIRSKSFSGARALFNAYVYLLMSALQVITSSGHDGEN